MGIRRTRELRRTDGTVARSDGTQSVSVSDVLASETFMVFASCWTECHWEFIRKRSGFEPRKCILTRRAAAQFNIADERLLDCIDVRLNHFRNGLEAYLHIIIWV